MKTPQEIITKRGLPLNAGIEDAMNEFAVQFIHPKDCYQCDGQGKITLPSLVRMDCMICNGTGKLILLPTQQNT